MIPFYIVPVLVLVIGIILYFGGSKKNNNKLTGAGIGIVVCLIVLESPGFIQGFVEGYTSVR